MKANDQLPPDEVGHQLTGRDLYHLVRLARLIGDPAGIARVFRRAPHLFSLFRRLNVLSAQLDPSRVARRLPCGLRSDREVGIALADYLLQLDAVANLPRALLRGLARPPAGAGDDVPPCPN